MTQSNNYKAKINSYKDPVNLLVFHTVEIEIPNIGKFEHKPMSSAQAAKDIVARFKKVSPDASILLDSKWRKIK